jgi:hypothetical protein
MNEYEVYTCINIIYTIIKGGFALRMKTGVPPAAVTATAARAADCKGLKGRGTRM